MIKSIKILLFSVFIYILVFIFISILILMLINSFLSSDSCNTKCNEEGALASYLRPSGHWSNKDDVCVCFFEEKVKAFKLGEK